MIAALILAGSLFPPQLAKCGAERLLPHDRGREITATSREADGRWLVRTETWEEGDAIGAPVGVTRWTFLVEPKSCAVAGFALTGEWPAIGRGGNPGVGEPPSGWRGYFVRSKNVRAVDERTRATLIALADVERATEANPEHHEALAAGALPEPPRRERSERNPPLFSAPRDPIAFVAGSPRSAPGWVARECEKEPVLPGPIPYDACAHLVVIGGTGTRDVVRRDTWAIVQSGQGGFALVDVACDRTAWLGQSESLFFLTETDGIVWLEGLGRWDPTDVLAIDVRRGTLWTMSRDGLGAVNGEGVRFGETRTPWSAIRAKLPE